MKKKTIYGIIAAVIVVALAAMIIFVITGDQSSDTPANDTSNLKIEGVWDVVAYSTAGIPTFVDGEFMKFDAEKAYSFKNSETEPFAISSYEVTADGKLKLPEVSREYVLDVKTENCIQLYQTKDNCIVLLRHPNEDMSEYEIAKEDLLGKWNVVLRGGSTGVSEILEFDESTLTDYRDGNPEPFAVSSYNWDDEKTIFVDAWNKKYECRKLADGTVLFVDMELGTVWELEAVK